MKNRIFTGTLLFFALLPLLSVHSFEKEATEGDPFAVSYDEGPTEVKPGENIHWAVQFVIPEDSYLYAESLTIDVDDWQGIKVGDLEKDDPEQKDDPFMGQVVDIYHVGVELRLPLAFPDELAGKEIEISGEINYQGCSSNLCFKLNHLPFNTVFKVTGKDVSVPAVEIKKTFFEKILEKLRSANFEEMGLFWSLLIAFLGGILTDLTPCVWPMIPVILAVVGVRKDSTRWHNALALGIMILGMAVMYAALGLFAALAGKGLGFIFQQTAFLIILTFLLFAMSLSLLGLFQLRLPHSLQQRLSQLSAEGYRGVFLTGMTLGLMAAPCVGPVMGPLLVFVAQKRQVLEGVCLLLAYALGMGLPFVAMGLFFGDLKKRLKSGPWMIWVERLLGLLLLLVALNYCHTLYLTFVGKQGATAGSFWLQSLEEGKKKAAKTGKPMIVDFFAQWCPPCIELDKNVWNNTDIEKLLKDDWVPVKIDCTKETEICREAVDELQVVGWPTVVFFQKNGQEMKSVRMVGKVIDAEEMLRLLNQVEGSSL